MRTIPDCSFLAHALIPSQRTPEAVARMAEIDTFAEAVVLTVPILAEFTSLLRKLVARRSMVEREAEQSLELIWRLRPVLVSVAFQDMQAAWVLARRLQTSDAFDALACVVAMRNDAELWTCDRRFWNAARSAGESATGRVRYIV